MANFVKLSVYPATKKLLMDDCIKEYLKHHPEMMHIHITEEKIVYELVKFYLKTG